MTTAKDRRSSATAAADSDSDYLRALGVEPRLKRALGFFTGSLFAIAFQGPTTGALLVSGATLAIGGPAFIWAIPLIFIFQFVLALLWAELSSHYPLTGGIFQWANQLGGRFTGWITGLFYVVGIVLVMPAVGLVMNVVLAGIFTGFPLSSTSEVVTSLITTAVAGLIMASSVRFVAMINSIGVVLELVVLLGAAIALFFHHHQPLSVLTTSGGAQGTGSYLSPFLIVVALVVTPAGRLRDGRSLRGGNQRLPHQAQPGHHRRFERRRSDPVHLRLLPAPVTSRRRQGDVSPDLIPTLLNSQLGSGFAKIFLIGAFISVASTGIATLATIVRCIYGMARNNQLPAHGC